MSHWDSEKGQIIYWPAIKSQRYPDWDIIDCGCCSGIEWGGEYPRECITCGGYPIS